MPKVVRAIPATINKFTAKPVDSRKKRKVAGYARVSTDHEDQQTSYAAQVKYYTEYIKSRDDWEFGCTPMKASAPQTLNTGKDLIRW